MKNWTRMVPTKHQLDQSCIWKQHESRSSSLETTEVLLVTAGHKMAFMTSDHIILADPTLQERCPSKGLYKQELSLLIGSAWYHKLRPKNQELPRPPMKLAMDKTVILLEHFPSAGYRSITKIYLIKTTAFNKIYISNFLNQ